MSNMRVLFIKFMNFYRTFCWHKWSVAIRYETSYKLVCEKCGKYENLIELGSSKYE